MEKTRYWKKEAWRLVSLWIRQKHSDQRGFVKCVTCITTMHWKNMHAGHYKKRGNTSVFLYENNLGPQCPYCNGNLDGNIKEFEKYIIKVHGHEELEHINFLSKKTEKMMWFEFKEIADYYKDKLIKNNYKIT